MRTILLLDIDCFFASVEVALHPELRGKPLVVRRTAAMDRVYRVTEDNGRTTIQLAPPQRGAVAYRTGG